MGFDIDGRGGGSMLRDSSGIHVAAAGAAIRDCAITNALFGIYLREAHGVVVERCTVRGIPGKAPGEKGSGIHAWNTNEFRLAGNVTDITGSQQQVAQYDLLSDGALPQSELKLWGDSGSTRFDVSAWFGGESHYQRYSGLLDFNRVVKADIDYQRFPHPLGHDTMWYVDSASGIGGTCFARHC